MNLNFPVHHHSCSCVKVRKLHSTCSCTKYCSCMLDSHQDCLDRAPLLVTPDEKSTPHWHSFNRPGLSNQDWAMPEGWATLIRLQACGYRHRLRTRKLASWGLPRIPHSRWLLSHLEHLSSGQNHCSWHTDAPWWASPPSWGLACGRLRSPCPQPNHKHLLSVRPSLESLFYISVVYKRQCSGW